MDNFLITKNGILEDLTRHIFIEMYYNERPEFLFEKFNRDKIKLFEQYGIFKGCEDIARNVVNTIKNYYKDSKLLYVPVGNWFIDTIRVYITNTEGFSAAYQPNSTLMDENGRFSVLSIAVDIKSIEGSDNFLGLIMHELTHAYQEYNLLQKGMSLKSNQTDLGYYKNELGKYEDIDLKDTVSYILYYFNGYETGAYMASIKGELINYKGTFDNISDVIDYIKNCDAYYNYETVFSYANLVINLRTEDEQGEALQYFKELSNYDFKDFNELCRWLRDKIIHIKDKVERMIPKMVFQHANMNTVATQQHVGRLKKK